MKPKGPVPQWVCVYCGRPLPSAKIELIHRLGK